MNAGDATVAATGVASRNGDDNVSELVLNSGCCRRRVAQYKADYPVTFVVMRFSAMCAIRQCLIDLVPDVTRIWAHGSGARI